MVHTIGFIGLGKMGKNMVLHLREQGIDVVAYNRTPLPEASVVTIEDLVGKLSPPRIVWLMIPARQQPEPQAMAGGPNGGPIDEVLTKLTLSSGDILIDGGNTFYKDTVRRSGELAARGIYLIDCGTSGGLEGARSGACLMLGGDEDVVKGLAWLWDAVALRDGWSYFGPSGAGHFVKMVHNGIEYGEVQAIGEGVEILSKGPYHLDLAKVAATWQKGSIIRSFLVDLLGRALKEDPALSGFTGKVGGGETGGWTLAAAREFGVEVPVLESALSARQKSQENQTVSGKVVSALRRQYGGHDEAK